MRCPRCLARPARRACPALGHDICPVCCGTSRETAIRCPDTCAYLEHSRHHPPATVRRQQEHDLALLMPGMAGLTEPRQQLYLFCLTLIDRFRGDGLDAATDADVAAAAGSLASTYETATHGIIYEHRAESVPAQRLAAEIKTVFEELGRGRPSAFAADATAVLRRLEARVQAVQKLEASNPRAFVAVSGRVARRFAAGDGAAGPAPDAPAVPASPIIIP